MITKKLWNILVMFIIVCGSVFVLASCSKEDAESTPEVPSEIKTGLVGTWDGTITAEGETFKVILVLKSDGTFIETSERGYNNFYGEWTDNGDGTMTLTRFLDSTFKFTLQGNKLFLTGTYWTASLTRR